MDRTRDADCEDAAIVSVELIGLALGVTDEGDKAQVGIGAGPATAQESWIAFMNDPFWGLMVMTSFPCAPDCRLRLVAAGLKEKSIGLNVAVTDSLALMVTMHAPVPEQAPLQPDNP